MNWRFWAGTRKPKNSCAAIQPLLSLQSDGMVSPDEAQALETHLESCAACREELRWIQATHLALAQRPVAVPPSDLQARIARAIAQAEKTPVRLRVARRPVLLGPALAAACAAAIVATFALPALWTARPMHHASTPVPSPAVVAARPAPVMPPAPATKSAPPAPIVKVARIRQSAIPAPTARPRRRARPAMIAPAIQARPSAPALMARNTVSPLSPVIKRTRVGVNIPQKRHETAPNIVIAMTPQPMPAPPTPATVPQTAVAPTPALPAPPTRIAMQPQTAPEPHDRLIHLAAVASRIAHVQEATIGNVALTSGHHPSFGDESDSKVTIPFAYGNLGR